MDQFITDTTTYKKLFARCITDCPVTPPCPPNCEAEGKVCQQTVRTCEACVTNYCGVDLTVTSPAGAAVPSAPSAPASNPPSTGAIAGGVVGGLAVIAAITYLVWRFCIKNKREAVRTEPWDEEQDPASLEAEKAFALRRDQRASTHTTHSIASTVLTRASNIIQIAYIPGVTNRATPTSPTLLVPPVPPIPIALSQASSPSATEEQHFFVPGDLRDSTYSGISGYSDRTSYARTSYAPRSSIASTIYGKSAVVVAPAQTGMRAKPAMVSVKSTSSSGTHGSHTPPVPAVDYDKYTGIRPPSPANSTFSVGSTFLNNASAHTAMAARPMVVRVGSGPKKVTTGSPLGDSSPLALSPLNSTRDSKAVTIIEDSPSPDQGPFSDPPERIDTKSTGSLSAVIEEATRRASQRTTTGTSTDRERSPFGDENAVKDT